MIDPYGSKLCPHCGKPSYDTSAKEICPGPSIEEMHKNLDDNLRKFTFLTEIPRKGE